MALQAPDWLTKRGGSLRQGPAGGSWFVVLNGQPQYQLIPVPVAGKHACEVVQTVNGRHLESNATYGSVEDAGRGGLEDLRKALGW